MKTRFTNSKKDGNGGDHNDIALSHWKGNGYLTMVVSRKELLFKFRERVIENGLTCLYGQMDDEM